MPKILTYPEAPRPHNKLFMIAEDLGYELTTNLEDDYEVGFFNSYQTITPDTFKPPEGILNAGCYDVSKSRVDRIFEKVFGYSSLVDPLTHKGQMVEKDEAQCTRQQRILNGPYEPKKGKVYQRLIDTYDSDKKHFTDVRLPVFGGKVPFFILKYKPERFGKWNTCDVKEPLDPVPISPKEYLSLTRFIFEFGLDFGEIDALIDNDTGKFYIIDVNNIAGSRLYTQLGKIEGPKMRKEFAEQFKGAFL